MSRLRCRFGAQAALGMFLAGCAAQSDFSGATSSPIAMACDGGRTFTVAYADGFETAIIEAGGQRFELSRIRTALSMTPTPPGFGARPVAPPFLGAPGREGLDDTDEFGGPAGGAAVAGTTGVRYGSDEAYFISRNQEAVLEVGDEIYSNCEVART